ncbi:MAG: type II toxin-antitoxin system HicA family toxin [Candidatus Hydrogenedentes bacterium]|nr:type II toxin-antitoxin system HicA family toxin [Candidatus Hydrogenedentota bacterium]
MNSRQRATLKAIFEHPTRADVRWADIESLFRALGGEVEEGNGSRVRVALKGCRATFHRPYPQPKTKKGALESVRNFLTSVEVKP